MRKIQRKKTTVMGELVCSSLKTMILAGRMDINLPQPDPIFNLQSLDACLHAYCPTLRLMRVSTPSAMLGAYACLHAFIWESRQASERVWLERNGTKGERAVACVYTPLASISSYQRSYWKYCSDACLHAYCPTLRPMRASTPLALLGAYA